MRYLASRLLLLLSTAAYSIAATPPKDAKLASVEEDVLGQKAMTTEDSALDGSTTFNGMKVPPLKAIDGEKFQEEAKEGYW